MNLSLRLTACESSRPAKKKAQERFLSGDWEPLLTNPSAIHNARALLTEQIGKFTLERVQIDGKIAFKADGEIDFFRDESLTRVGAGGPDRT